MEGPTALKRTLHDDETSASAAKRLKAVEPMDVDSPSAAPPAGSSVLPSEAAGTSPEADASGEKSAEVTEPAKVKGKTAQGMKKDKKEKNVGRRRRGTRNDEPAAEGKETSDQPKAPRLPKRQCALLIGFCGSGYSGMQIQPDHTKTIEGVLFQAMVRAGAVSQDNADDPTKAS
ncbi:hypothetical protein DXG03_009418 [Asterophora parasitica]|uniref:tRNA pseudouridine synthase n=1 Tax=Asterophora parasitica TaxID=117018 RepID=A0A9P7GCE4_9AGAR|nr:hypothetical protein DXG03_009418 [Asterophora parasitica]